MEAVMRYRISLMCILGLVLSMSLSHAQPSQQATQRPTVLYFPIATTAPALYGTVTEHGQPAAGVEVWLYICVPTRIAPVCGPLTQQATNDRGEYRFTQQPSLGPDQSYYVAYGATPENARPNRLVSWGTNSIMEYTAGTTLHVADFDIGSVDPMLPASGTALPQSSIATTVTLQLAWTPRANQPQEQYTVYIQTRGDPCCNSSSIVEYPVGHTGGFSRAFAYQPNCTHCDLPVFEPNTIYRWSIGIENGNGRGQTQEYTFTLPLQSLGLAPSPADARREH
jgi:hypothetical protein